MNLAREKMAAPYCNSQLRLLWQHSKTLSYQVAKRRFTLSNAKQKKKSSKSKQPNLDDSLSSVAGKKSAQSQNDFRGRSIGLSSVTLGDGELDTFDCVFKDFSQSPAAPSFKQILQTRHSQAERSVIIRTQNPESTIRSLMSFGDLKHAHFVSQDKAFILAEFAREESIARLQFKAGFFSEANQFPMRSRILYDISTRPHKKRTLVPQIGEGNWNEKTSKTYPVMDTIEKELEELCTRRSLDDNDLRSRFFLCLQLEELLQSFLPESHVIPYGSCLNGFGWWNSDLDMMLCFSKELYSADTIRTPVQNDMPSNFKILTEIFSSSRHLAQRTLAMVASLLELSPRVQHVFKILNARVPIIRFKNVAVNLDCDISVQAMDSIKMTELLYLYSVCDPRVKPLMAGIKQWAICHNLTSSGEQQKPTTIGILTMLIFYLQTRSPPVVPTLRKLQALASTSEMFYIENVVYGLPSSPSIIPKSQNGETLESLLHGFFTFYSDFDFKNKAISIIEGATFTKPADSTPVHIENPLCVGLNICRNVGSIQLNLFADAMKEAALKLETLATERDSNRLNVTSVLSDKSQKSRLSVLFCNSPSREQPVAVDIVELFAEKNLAVANDNRADNNTDENHTVQIEDQLGHSSEVTKVQHNSNCDSRPPSDSKKTSGIVQSTFGLEECERDTALVTQRLNVHNYSIADGHVGSEPSSSNATAKKTI